MVLRLPEEAVRRGSGLYPAGLEFPKDGPFPIPGSGTSRIWWLGSVLGDTHLSEGPWGCLRAARGGKTGRTVKKGGHHRGKGGDTPSRGPRQEDPTDVCTTLDICSYPLPLTVFGKTPPDFRGLAWRLGACPLKSGAIIFGLTHHPWNPEAEAHPCPHCCPLGQGLLIHWDPGAQSGGAPLRRT